jgi:hypothetical protein
VATVTHSTQLAGAASASSPAVNPPSGTQGGQEVGGAPPSPFQLTVARLPSFEELSIGVEPNNRQLPAWPTTGVVDLEEEAFYRQAEEGRRTRQPHTPIGFCPGPAVYRHAQVRQFTDMPRSAGSERHLRIIPEIPLSQGGIEPGTHTEGGHLPYQLDHGSI